MTTRKIPAVGSLAPDFRLRGPGGAFYTLSEHLGANPVVLVFYPLAFSPGCSHQLPSMQARLPQFEELGAIVYGISVDSYHSNAAFARSLKLDFPLLSDWDCQASRDYGVLLEGPDISIRAVFVIGKDGRVLFSDITDDLDDYDHMPGPEGALAALKQG
jgi:peroxiredoxin